MTRQNKVAKRKLLLAVQSYISFFLLMAFILTTCILLFAEVLRETM